MFWQKDFVLFISRNLSGVQLYSPAEGRILRLAPSASKIFVLIF